MIGTTPSQLGGLQVTWCDTVRSSHGTRMFLESIWVLLTLRRSTASQLSLHVATSVFTPRDSVRGSLLPPRARDHRRGDLIASPFGLHARLRWTRLCLRRAGRGRRRARARVHRIASTIDPRVPGSAWCNCPSRTVCVMRGGGAAGGRRGCTAGRLARALEGHERASAARQAEVTMRADH